MAGRKSDFTLPTNTLDELFSSQEERDEAKLSKIRDIPLEEIDDFPDHPFKVREDEDMFQLVESIKERGVITPATVRQKEDGRYELISGHRRKRACELAGFETLRCEVVDLDRDEATILMVESNFQRSQILPSEKAHAYKMRLDAMKRQAGRPRKENSSPVGIDLRGKQSLDLMSEECGDIVGIVFIVIFSVLLIFAPHFFAAIFTEGEAITTVPVFNLEQWGIVLPVFVISLLIGLIDEILRLIIGVYCKLVMISNILCGVIQIVLSAIVLKVLPIWNPNFVLEIEQALGANADSSANFFTYWNADMVSNGLLAFIVVITLFEIGVTIYKTLRYGVSVKNGINSNT